MYDVGLVYFLCFLSTRWLLVLMSSFYFSRSLFVMDAAHVPYGCSVWPAWWSVAENWPSGGEIDTFEGVS